MKNLRSTTSVLTALTFVAGSLFIPTAHLAFHSLPHDHLGGGLSYHAVNSIQSGATSLPLHRHDQYGDDVAESASGTDFHTHPVDDDGTTDTPVPTHRHDRQPFDPHHGDGSVSHFAVAVSDGAAAAIVPLLWPGPAAMFAGASAARSAQRVASFRQPDRGPPLLLPL